MAFKKLVFGKILLLNFHYFCLQFNPSRYTQMNNIKIELLFCKIYIQFNICHLRLELKIISNKFQINDKIKNIYF